MSTQDIELSPSQQTTQELSVLQLLDLCPSVGMRQVMEGVQNVAKRRSTVLITGETGVGKELVARAIHTLSPRSRRPFVVANCANQTGQLIADEFFGHVRGAFTGAFSERQGLFEHADQGTLFLDEVGELPMELQPKLLRVLQERVTTRLGGTHSTEVDFRLVVGTNKNLAELTKHGKFRDDLFHRLNVFPIHVPPLRDRMEDIDLLSAHFISTTREETDPTRLSDAGLDKLKTHSWPGNVRELKNVIERALISAQGDSIAPEDLCLGVVSTAKQEVGIDTETKVVEYILDRSLQEGILPDVIEVIKALVLEEAYQRFGSWRKVAENLGVNIRTINHIRKRYSERAETH